MANIITSCRIVCSIAMLFVPALSPVFYILYLIAGFTDMVDGTVARKTNSVSEFGSKLDSVADFVLVVACLIKLLPVMHIPVWLWIWIANKVTGFLLFVLPLTLSIVDLKYSAIVVCVAATFAAIQEGYRIKTGKTNL